MATNRKVCRPGLACAKGWGWGAWDCRLWAPALGLLEGMPSEGVCVWGRGWTGALALGLDPREAAAVPFTPGSRTSPSGALLAEPRPTSSDSSDLDAGVSQRRSQQRHSWHHHMHKDATKGYWEQGQITSQEMNLELKSINGEMKREPTRYDRKIT